MITFGHSLGGNMLASSLKEEMVDIVRNRARCKNIGRCKNSIVKPPFGNLIVLLNPASEANKWTAIQREMRKHIDFQKGILIPAEKPNTYQRNYGHDFYPKNQPPIYISLTAAYEWPAGGSWDREKRHSKEYDGATFYMFPAGKGDFRPIAEVMENDWPLGIRAKCKDGEEFLASLRCFLVDYPAAYVLPFAAKFARNFPFQNTDKEQTRTIGHLTPVRVPFVYNKRSQRYPATLYGTTHEIGINKFGEKCEKDQKEGCEENDLAVSFLTRYENASSYERSQCKAVPGWLSLGTNWKWYRLG